MHTVSGPLGLRRVEIRTLHFWARHVDVFLEQRCLESNVVKNAGAQKIHQTGILTTHLEGWL